MTVRSSIKLRRRILYRNYIEHKRELNSPSPYVWSGREVSKLYFRVAYWFVIVSVVYSQWSLNGGISGISGLIPPEETLFLIDDTK